MVTADRAPAGPRSQSLTPLVDALEGTLRVTAAMVEELSEAEWELPTDCPAWTVRDQVSHLIGVERHLLGDPPPVIELPDLAHVRTDFDRFTERDVHARRGQSPAALLAELTETIDRRMALLRDPALGVDSPLPSPFGVRPAGWVLRLRCFDCWMHEQDIRFAVSRPGGLMEPAAGIAVAWVRRALPRVVAELPGMSPGHTLRLTVDGPHGFVTVLGVGADGRGVDLGTGEADRPDHPDHPAQPAPDVAVRVSTEAFMRRAGGRWPVERLGAQVTGPSAGQQLAQEFLTALAITP